MVMVDIQGEQRYLDGYLMSNLDKLKEAVAKNWDGVLLFGGYEGDGKTTLCSQCMAYLDPSFDLSRVCFNLNQVGKLMDTLPPGSAIMYDESWKDISNTSRFSVEQKKLIKMLTEKRKRRLYIGIVAATFFDLNKYFVIHRTRAYIHIYTKELERGYFKFYNRERKQDLYIRGRRDWNLNVAKPNFMSRFTNWLPFDAEEYDAIKEAYTRATEKEESVEQAEKNNNRLTKEVKKEVIGALVSFLIRNRWLKKGGHQAISDFLSIDRTTLHNWQSFSVKKQALPRDFKQNEESVDDYGIDLKEVSR